MIAIKVIKYILKFPFRFFPFKFWTKCGNTDRRATAKCWNQLIEDMFQIQNIIDSKIKIPTICWSV